LDEPFFNTSCPAIKKFVPDHHFLHITEKNESNYYKKIQYLLGRHFFLRKESEAIIGDCKRVTQQPVTVSRKTLKHLRNILFETRPLMKSPNGVFSAEWLASRFNMDVVVLIRHPAAFAGSLKDLGWGFDFREYLDQPLLMEDLLSPFENEIKEYVRSKHDIIDIASLLWKSIYYTVAQYKKCHKDWMFVRHEDISTNPVFWFRNIFERFGLKFTRKIETTIEESTSEGNPYLLKKNDKGRFSTNRNSKKNIYAWKYRLTTKEIERLRVSVQDVSKEFYDDKDWNSG